MKERVARFGSASPLVGIVTEPPGEARGRGGPAVIFLNSGLLHRVGGSRMHVRMARALAADGTTCLRFDYSGLGDSETRRDSLPFEQSGVLETIEAMDYVARTKGATRFVLAGLCSGADMAFWTALEDPRVVGIFQIDPFDYHTPRFYLHRYGHKAFTLRPWLNILTGHSHLGRWVKDRVVGATTEGPGAELVQSPYDRAFPPRVVVAGGLAKLTGRGVRIYALFTGGREHSYQGQFRDAFRDVDLAGCVTERYHPDADHLVTDLAHQRWLDAELLAWVRELARAEPASAGHPGGNS